MARHPRRRGTRNIDQESAIRADINDRFLFVTCLRERWEGLEKKKKKRFKIVRDEHSTHFKFARILPCTVYEYE